MIKLQLGAHHFTVGPIKPRRSFPLQAKFWPIVLEVAGLFAKLSSKEGSDGDGEDATDAKEPFSRIAKLFEADVEKVLPVFSGVLSSISYDDLAFIQRELLSETFVDGARLYADKPGGADLFDVTLVGRTVDTWKLMWEALKITYPDFLAPLLARAGRAGAAEASAA